MREYSSLRFMSALNGARAVRWIRASLPQPGEKVYRVDFTSLDGDGCRGPDAIFVYATGPTFSAVAIARHHAASCIDSSSVREVRCRESTGPRGLCLNMKYRVRDGRVIHEWC